MLQKSVCKISLHYKSSQGKVKYFIVQMLDRYCQQFSWLLKKKNKKKTWKIRNVNEKEIKVIPLTFWKFKLYLDLGDREETSTIRRLPKGSGDLRYADTLNWQLLWGKVKYLLIVKLKAPTRLNVTDH